MMKKKILGLIMAMVLCLVAVPAIGSFQSVEAAENQPLTFTANTANSKVYMDEVKADLNICLEYRQNTNGGWTDWGTFIESTESSKSVEIKLDDVGDQVQLRAKNTNGSFAYYQSDTDQAYSHFVMTGSIAASGNIMSLVDKNFDSKTSMAMANRQFASLFKGCSSLTTAPELPATELAYRCYDTMFSFCSSLTTAPKLPATTLEGSCYNNMFFLQFINHRTGTSGDNFDGELL